MMASAGSGFVRLWTTTDSRLPVAHPQQHFRPAMIFYGQPYERSREVPMKTFLLAGVAIAALAVPAMAADLSPARAPVYTKAPAPVPAFSWTGFYIGANIGGGWATATDSATLTLTGVGTFGASTSSTASGVIGGGQIGYNWQAGNVVFGVEADFDGSGERSTSTLLCPTAACGAIISSATATDKVEDFGTVRGRLGLAFDRWLVYATGGASWQTVNSVYAVTAAGLTTGVASSTTTRGGYAVGGGVETALWGNNWIGGVEYLYLDTGTFGTGTASLAAIAPAPAGSTLATTARIQNNIVRARLSYKF
jgi:outer membrane immunogenic protein